MANLENSSTLFPILQPPRLTALGRAAADAEQIDAGHDVRFRALQSRSILNKSVSKRLHWMAWSINPYRGCEFGCRYCYARYTHEFFQPGNAPANEHTSVLESFEREIFVKQNAAWLLEQDLRRLTPAQAAEVFLRNNAIINNCEGRNSGEDEVLCGFIAQGSDSDEEYIRATDSRDFL